MGRFLPEYIRFTPARSWGCGLESGWTTAGIGGVPEWLKGADCKSAGDCLRRFESYPHHDVFHWAPRV